MSQCVIQASEKGLFIKCLCHINVDMAFKEINLHNLGSVMLYGIHEIFLLHVRLQKVCFQVNIMTDVAFLGLLFVCSRKSQPRWLLSWKQGFFKFWDGQLEAIGFRVMFCILIWNAWLVWGCAGVGQAEGFGITEDGNSAWPNWSSKNLNLGFV